MNLCLSFKVIIILNMNMYGYVDGVLIFERLWCMRINKFKCNIVFDRFYIVYVDVK